MPTDATPDWVQMLDAHAAQGIAAPCRCPDCVTVRQAEFEETPR